ncbi:MAG: hypothetical protein OXI49_10880 [Acidobacteriota bacterium]|nr:hypothetical protein [Acidobacteriota bacterium]
MAIGIVAAVWHVASEVSVLRGEVGVLKRLLSPESLKDMKAEVTASVQRELEGRIEEEIEAALKGVRADVEALQQAQRQIRASNGSASIDAVQSRPEALCGRDQRNSVHLLPAGTILPSEMPPDVFLSGGRDKIWRLANGDFAPRRTDYAQLVARGQNDVRLPDLRGMNLRGRQLHYYVKVC